jgi:hypothetical protein
MMTGLHVRRQSILRAALALLLLAAPCGASAQYIPGLVAKPDISIFGSLPANLTPNFGYYSPVVFGYSVGGFYQTRQLIGVEVRGSIQRRLNAQHQESALVGPRVALHFGHISPYISLLGGAGHGWRYLNPPATGKVQPQPIAGIGGQWTLLGGADFHMNHHLAFRVGEISYSKLYLKNWNLTPLNITAGVVYRIN